MCGVLGGECWGICSVGDGDWVMYPFFAVGWDLNSSFLPFFEPSHWLQNHLRRFLASASVYPVHARWNVWPHVLLELAQAMVGLFASL